MIQPATFLTRVARALFAASTLCAASALFAACGSTPTEHGGPPEELRNLPRALTAEENRVRDAANQFSLALWERVNNAQRDSNVFLSPLSVSFALGMTMNGAAGTTYREIQHALQFDDAPLPEINEGYRSLIALLQSLDPSVDMRVANSIWYSQEFPFRQTFFDTTKKYFDAQSQGLDFGNPAASLAAINGWAKDATNNRIPKVLEGIDRNHVMFLLNAIYFKGSWRAQFDPKATLGADFHSAGGIREPVQLMFRADTIGYRETSEYQAVELPYGNRAFVMNVLLPKPGVDIEALAAALPSDALQSGNYTSTRIDLFLPKIRMEYERRLNDDLQAMGMQNPFSPGADFTNLSPPPSGHSLFIDFVKQNSFVDINEEGTEAAAVTVVAIGRTSMPSHPVMRVDRPYVFVIRERLTGTILFLGKIVRVPQP